MAELTRSEQIAYEASAARTKKQAARDRGAADALKGNFCFALSDHLLNFLVPTNWPATLMFFPFKTLKSLCSGE